MVSDRGIGRLQKAVADGRKDGLLIDCGRLIGIHYGKIVEHFSAAEGRPISAHNNKTLFLEGIDYWCRSLFTGQNGRRGTTEDAKEMILRVMEPWYEAMELEDPSQYKMGRRDPLPLYTGTPEDVIAVELGMAACLDIAPMSLRYGMDGNEPKRVWGRVQADGKWYDTDPTEPGFSLGNYVEYPEYTDVEIPL